MQVSRAKVVNRGLRGNLAFIVQTPGRFRGGVEFAGNELVTLSFHEEGYALRYKLDAFPPGYYEGPPDGCAVQALLGISIGTEALVSLMLGGAPLIAAPYEVVDQGWSRKQGWEAVVIRNDRYIQELRFNRADGQWQFVGGELWARAGESKGAWLWTVEHRSLRNHGAVRLPDRTLVSAPGERTEELVTIIYKSRNLDPAFARVAEGGDGSPDDGADDAGGDDWGDEDGGDEEGGDGWEDEGDWEGDGESVPQQEGPGPAQTTGRGETAVASKSQSPDTPSSMPRPQPRVPEVFKLVPGTLTHRGDLCRPAERRP